MPLNIKNKILTALTIFLFTISSGILGYGILTPRSTTLDALYMTIITLSTVGYGEVIDLTNNPAGKIFTMVLIMFGMGNLLFVVTTLTSFITDGELQDLLRKRRMEKMIEKIKDHIIVCGSGIICKRIIQELTETKHQFVFISDNPEDIKLFTHSYPDILFITGDPSCNEILLSAGISAANGFIVALPDDRDSLLTVVTAKKLNPHIRIVASVIIPEAIDKFKAVGVDTVISPTLIGGLRVVSEMIRPSVTTFLDTMLRDKSSNIRFEDVIVSSGSSLIDQTIRHSGIKDKTGLLVVSIRKPGVDQFIYNPSPEEKLTEGTTIIVIGSVDNVIKLKKLAGS